MTITCINVHEDVTVHIFEVFFQGAKHRTSLFKVVGIEVVAVTTAGDHFDSIPEVTHNNE